MYLVNSEDNELNYYTRPVAVIEYKHDFLELVRNARMFLLQNMLTEIRLDYPGIRFLEMESLPVGLQDELFKQGTVEVDKLQAETEERDCSIVVTPGSYWIEAELNMSIFTFVPHWEVK